MATREVALERKCSSGVSMGAITRKLLGALRPFYSPLTKTVRSRLGRNYFDHPEMELPLAYEALQLEVERRLHQYLHVPAEAIEQIVIVGANDGSEIPRLRRAYPRSRFVCFEPSPSGYANLKKSFDDSDFVECRKLALGDSVGTQVFHELPLAGNGSLLPPDIEHWSRFVKSDSKEVISFEVEVSTLDKEAARIKKIDLLWMDVQGAEGNVLRGAVHTVDRVSAIFLEVALVDSPYQGALLFSELSEMLTGFGFSCAGLGIDGGNYTGNSLWLRLPV
jgi:FkbM family methyltransferase